MRGNLELRIVVSSYTVANSSAFVCGDGSLFPSYTWFYKTGVIHITIVSGVSNRLPSEPMGIANVSPAPLPLHDRPLFATGG